MTGTRRLYTLVPLFLALAMSACASHHVLDRGVYAVPDTVATHYASTSAAGASGLTFQMRDGRATIVGTNTDSIRVNLLLGRHSDRDYRRDCLPEDARKPSIQLRRVANTIEIRLGNRSLKCAEHWNIEVPSSFTVTARAEVAHVTLSNMGSDSYATTDVGDVTIVSRRGSASAVVKSVGNASVESASSSYEEAVVESDVGKTTLLIDGHEVDVERAPGPGGRIALRGSGRDKLRAETGVGRARLSVGKTPAQ
jgi:hypothetical protein